MASLVQLQSEPWWDREIVTPELRWLGAELCRRTGRPADAFGSKGNTAHLSGGHRSQEWIKNSDYCTNTSYTVQTGLAGEQVRHIAACDWTPGVWGSSANRALVATQTKALFDAAKRGELTGVRQIFGTLDGRNPIGLNVVSNSITYPDDSHVDHLHFTFDRRYLRDSALMARIANIITGEDDMDAEDKRKAYNVDQLLVAIVDDLDEVPNLKLPNGTLINKPFKLAQRSKAQEAANAADVTRDVAVMAAIKALAEAGGVDAAPIVAKIQAEAEATRALVIEKHQLEMAELRRAHEAELAGLQAELDRLSAATGS